jgi:hypothetical protein
MVLAVSCSPANNCHAAGRIQNPTRSAQAVQDPAD